MVSGGFFRGKDILFEPLSPKLQLMVENTTLTGQHGTPVRTLFALATAMHPLKCQVEWTLFFL